MSKFHINKHGVPAPCRAKKGKCPLGGDSGSENHFNSAEEAQEFLDKENSSKFGILPETGMLEEEYYPANPSESEIGYFRNTVDIDEDNPVDRAFVENFGNDAIVAEIKSDNPMDYSLDSNDDGVYYGRQEMLNSVEKEGYDVSKVFVDRENDEYTPKFREAYGNFLKSQRGPVKEVFGKKFAKVASFNSSESEEDFVKSYIKTQEINDRPVAKYDRDTQDEFYNEEYYPLNPSTSELGYFKHTADSDGDSKVDKVFSDTFGDNTLVTEVSGDNVDPMSYSLDSNDDGVYHSHRYMLKELNDEGYDTNKIYSNIEEEKYTQEFRDSYSSYLKSRQSEPKEIFGKKFVAIPDAYDDKGIKDFMRNYLDNRK